MSTTKRVRNEDPKKVYDRQVKYIATKARLPLVVESETKDRFHKLKGSMTHDEFLNALLDKFEDKN